MGLFNRFHGKKTANWEGAYVARPQFYGKKGEEPFGAFALTESTDTVLPILPRYAVDGKPVAAYRLSLVSVTTYAVLGYIDYFEALAALKPYIVASNETSVLVRGMSLDELKTVQSRCRGIAL